MEPKIFILTPFMAMEGVVQQVLQERGHELSKEIQVCNADGLKVVPPIIKKAMEWGAEVIVSRGGLAVYLQEHIDIPVVEIQVTALDILQALRKAGTNPGRVGIAGIRNIIYECESLRDFIEVSGQKITLHEIPLSNEPNDSELLLEAARNGTNIFVGDATAVRLAGNLGLKSFLIESGKAAIYKAIKEAKTVVSVRRKERERAELLKTVIDTSTDGIIAVDKECHITIFNPVAAEIFRSSPQTVIGRLVNEVISNTRLDSVVKQGITEIGEIMHISDRILVTKRIPITVNNEVLGAIASFQDVTQLQRFEQAVRQKLYEKGLVAKCTLEKIVGSSQQFLMVKEQVRQYAKTNSTVLITGETGTGKELFAQSIHNLSNRKKGPFVAVNCAALPESLLESELFGYEEGAFTGAKRGGKMGLFELAHGGTLFLDEIGEMAMPLQARLLRTLQEKEVMRVGGHKVLPIDVRVVVATNQNLAKMVDENRFRADLYYRLYVLPIQIPPLRERAEDIPLLAKHFVRQFSELNSKVNGITNAAIAILQQNPWKGNVRELINVLERVVLLAEGPDIQAGDVEKVLGSADGSFRRQNAQTSFLPEECSGDAEEEVIWRRVAELRKLGLGPRRISRILKEEGKQIEYYQIAYRLKRNEGI